MTQKPDEYSIFVTIGANFTKHLATHVPGLKDILIRFLGQRVEVAAGET